MIRLSILDGLIHNFAFHQQQQHHLISSISLSTASAHQQHLCIGYRHWKIYLPIYIKSGHISLYPLTSPDELQTPPDMLQTPPDTIRHGPDTTRYHHTCIMYGLYGLKHHTVEISGDVTDPDGRTIERQANIELFSFWSVNRWVSQFHTPTYTCTICIPPTQATALFWELECGQQDEEVR